MSPIKKTLQHPKADKEKRSAFCEEVKKYKEQSRPLVFIDESGFAHDMPRTHGYATKGKRCFGTHDWGAKGRTNVIGALLFGALLTVSLFQTNVNTTIFNAWVVEDLIPKLPHKSVIIMDNASFHKGALMRNAIENAGHFTYRHIHRILIQLRRSGLRQSPKDARLVVVLKGCLKSMLYNQIIRGFLYYL